jgi:uncharacterized protein YigE (DUF2233 family)
MRILTWRGVLLFGIALVFLSGPGEGADWTKTSDGILLGRFAPPRGSSGADDAIIVLKIDPSRRRFKLLSALDQGGRARTGREWCEEFGLLAAINAGMYRKDLQNAGYMKEYDHTNNPKFNPAFGAFMVFNPKAPSLPGVRMIDSRADKDWRSSLDRYHSAIQSYRMISGGKKIAWPIQDKVHSIAAAGVDKDGHVLFIHSRAVFKPHDFIDMLLSFPIRIRDLLYLEGGDEASLCVRLGDRWEEWTGLSGIEILRSFPWTPLVPNVLGIAREP